MLQVQASEPNIPVAGPWITQKEIDYVTEAVRTAWYANANVFHRRFELAFAAHTGRKHAIALPSCTSALHLALLAAGVGPGDEVIVPEVTWIASSAPITYVGATPVFVDIEPDTWCISASSVSAAITAKTRALIAVDLYGSMPDYHALEALSSQYRLTMIEDAAESIGSRFACRPAGSFGRVSTFSFHGSKTVTSGEGGMLVTDDSSLFERACMLRDHGRTPGDRMFLNEEIGHKYKMSSMQAALGLAQLERLDELVAKKRSIHDWYREGLASLQGVTLHSESPGVFHSHWMVTASWPISWNLEKATVMNNLAEARIDSRPCFHPLSSLPAYASLGGAHAARNRNPVAYRIAPAAVNLPSALVLERQDVDKVCRVFSQIIQSAAPL